MRLCYWPCGWPDDNYQGFGVQIKSQSHSPISFSWLTTGSRAVRGEGWLMGRVRSTTTLRTHQALMARWVSTKVCVCVTVRKGQLGGRISACLTHLWMTEFIKSFTGLTLIFKKCPFRGFSFVYKVDWKLPLLCVCLCMLYRGLQMVHRIMRRSRNLCLGRSASFRMWWTDRLLIWARWRNAWPQWCHA